MLEDEDGDIKECLQKFILTGKEINYILNKEGQQDIFTQSKSILQTSIERHTLYQYLTTFDESA